jgi:membrane peptidoglycan carboxypeptidase
MRNAVRECKVEIAEDEECPAAELVLRVPEDTDIYKRRNFVLEQMKIPSRSVLSGKDHTAAEYDAAMREPLILTPQATPPMKAPHFVWQVRTALGALLCGEEDAETCEAVDTGGYKVTTSLDWEMQQTVEKWLYASTRVTHLKTPAPVWEDLGIPKSEYGWLRNLRGANIHNGAAGVMDYKTGQILAYGGSGGYYLEGTKKFQPQFDVMSQGFRQLGSAVKPLNYLIGLDDHTMTASTMFMDVVTDFGVKGSGSFLPTQADGLERGPVRLRSALQFSFNIPAIKAGLINGIDHAFTREQEMGLTFPPGAVPVVSQSVGAIETHPIDMLGAYGAIANDGVLMPRTMILEVKDKDGKVVFPVEADDPVGKRIASPQASYIIQDILAGNTVKTINPVWGQWQILEKTEDGTTRRPAAYKTGTTNDRKDTAAFGFLAKPDETEAPALVVGVWMGNSDNTPNTDALSLESAAPLWSRIMTEISQDTPIAKFQQPDGLVKVEVDAFSGLLPGPGTVATVEELFIKDTEPTRKDDLHVSAEIDAATGDLWQDGCTGPKETRRFLDFSQVEPRFPEWQRYTQEWAQRASRGVGVRGGPKKTRTMYFYNLSFHPFGATWGGRFKPNEVCNPSPQPCPPGGPPTADPSGFVQPCVTPPPTEEPTPSHGNPKTDPPNPTPTPTKGGGGGKPTPTPKATTAPTAVGPAGVVTASIAPVAFLPFGFALLPVFVRRRFRPLRRSKPLDGPPRKPRVH